MRKAEAAVANPNERNKKTSKKVNDIVNDPNIVVAISEHTLLEFHNNIATRWRDTQVPEYNQEWAEQSLADVMESIASGQLEIVPVPPKAAEHAMTLVTIATRDHNNSFRAWDAVHLLTAAAWAWEVGSVVKLTTTDTDFERFVSLFSYFKAYVAPNNLDY